MLFSNKFENLSDGVMVLRKFMTEEFCHNILEDLSCSEFSKRKDGLSVYKSTEKILFDSDLIESHIREVIPSSLHVMTGGFQFMSIGDSMAKHHDLYDFDFKTANKEYSIVLYLNKFNGGEISYPDINLKYSPEVGDLIMHKPNLRHEVLEVKSKNRYTYTSFLWSKRNVI